MPNGQPKLSFFLNGQPSLLKRVKKLGCFIEIHLSRFCFRKIERQNPRTSTVLSSRRQRKLKNGQDRSSRCSKVAKKKKKGKTQKAIWFLRTLRMARKRKNHHHKLFMKGNPSRRSLAETRVTMRDVEQETCRHRRKQKRRKK